MDPKKSLEEAGLEFQEFWQVFKRKVPFEGSYPAEGGPSLKMCMAMAFMTGQKSALTAFLLKVKPKSFPEKDPIE